jgi:WD40 repeat protein
MEKQTVLKSRRPSWVIAVVVMCLIGCCACPYERAALALMYNSNVLVSLFGWGLGIFAEFVPDIPPLLSLSAPTEPISGDKVGRIAEWKRLSVDGTDIAVAWSPDSQQFAASAGGKIRVWEIPSGREVRTIAANQGAIRAMAFSSDKTMLLSGADQVTLWQLASGRAWQTFDEKAEWVAFSADGTKIAWGTKNGTQLFDVVNSKVVRAFSFGGSVAFSSDSKVLAIGDKDVSIFDATSGEMIRTLPAVQPLSVMFLPDGKTLAVADSLKVQKYDFSTGQMVSEHLTASMLCMSLASDGLLVASRDMGLPGFAIGDGIKLKSLVGGQRQWINGIARQFMTQLGIVNLWHSGCPLAFSPDGKFLASGSGGNAVKLWGVIR